MAKTTLIKFAGPDDNDNFKCLSVKGRLKVDPGKIYTRRTVNILNQSLIVEVTTVEPKFVAPYPREFDGVKGKDL